MKISRRNYRDTVIMKNIEVSLVSSGDGTEVIHHKLYEGARWAMAPADGWTALEHVTMLTGTLIYHGPDGDVILQQGDSVSASPVKEHALFTAATDVEFIYVTSQPQFHFYSSSVKDMMELAIRVEEKDGYTADHCNRIKEISMMIGKRMGLTANELFILNLAAFLHDIGKINVPIEVLNKPSKLTDEEFEMIKKHTTWGKEILLATNQEDLKFAADIVEQHHERFDGKGYPNGLANTAIRIEAAIITVVDAFDAMTSDRVYRKGLDIDEAFEELICNKGTMFNPLVVDTFLSLREDIISLKEVMNT